MASDCHFFEISLIFGLILCYLVLFCCDTAEKKDFPAFHIYWELKLEIDLTWGAEKNNKHGLATYPFMFFW